MSKVLRSRWVRTNGVKTHYIETGNDGPYTLVALHGGGHGSSGMAAMGALMRVMGDDVRAIAPDSIGGYGETDPLEPTPQGLFDRVRHTRDFVDALCLDRFSLMGNSQGAFAAVQYALENPGRVEKLVLVGSLTIAECLGIQQELTGAFKTLMNYDGTRAAMRRLLEAIIHDHGRITDELIDLRFAAATRPGAEETMKAFMKATASLRQNPVFAQRMDMRQSLPMLTKAIPTTFIWGELDIFSTAETGRAVERLLPDVKFHWIPNAGHQTQTDAPEKVAAIVHEFIISKGAAA